MSTNERIYRVLDADGVPVTRHDGSPRLITLAHVALSAAANLNKFGPNRPYRVQSTHVQWRDGVS